MVAARSCGVTGIVDDELAELVGGADDLAGLDAAAAHAGHAGRRPVIAAGRRVDLRRPAEVAEPHDQRVVQQPAVVQVFQQGRVAAIEHRQLALLQALEVVLVRVPAAVGDGDELHARLDQPPGQQARLAERASAVALARAVGLLAQVERLLGPGRGDQAVGLLVEAVAGLDRRGRSPRRRVR